MEQINKDNENEQKDLLNNNNEENNKKEKKELIQLPKIKIN